MYCISDSYKLHKTNQKDEVEDVKKVLQEGNAAAAIIFPSISNNSNWRRWGSFPFPLLARSHFLSTTPPLQKRHTCKA